MRIVVFSTKTNSSSQTVAANFSRKRPSSQISFFRPDGWKMTAGTPASLLGQNPKIFRRLCGWFYFWISKAARRRAKKKKSASSLSLTHTSSAARMQHGAFCSGRLIICESVCVCVCVCLRRSQHSETRRQRERGGPDVAKSNWQINKLENAPGYQDPDDN
jgi:hypothetical protein